MLNYHIAKFILASSNYSAMASQSEQKTLEFPEKFYVGHMIGKRGQTIRDMEELTGSTIKVVPTISRSEKFVVITEPPEAVEMAIELAEMYQLFEKHGMYFGNTKGGLNSEKVFNLPQIFKHTCQTTLLSTVSFGR